LISRTIKIRGKAGLTKKMRAKSKVKYHIKKPQKLQLFNNHSDKFLLRKKLREQGLKLKDYRQNQQKISSISGKRNTNSQRLSRIRSKFLIKNFQGLKKSKISIVESPNNKSYLNRREKNLSTGKENLLRCKNRPSKSN
jgi:hypothetical protein